VGVLSGQWAETEAVEGVGDLAGLFFPGIDVKTGCRNPEQD
jgi:hypothetical protein